jgi:Ca2+-binding EF-hand superfamily protein
MDDHEKDKFHLAEEAQARTNAGQSYSQAPVEEVKEQLGSFAEVNAMANELRAAGGKGMTWYNDSRSAKKSKMNAFEELRKIILKATDGNNSGGTTKKEFIEAMTTMSEPLNAHEAAALFKDITDGGYGKITTMKLDKYLDS